MRRGTHVLLVLVVVLIGAIGVVIWLISQFDTPAVVDIPSVSTDVEEVVEETATSSNPLILGQSVEGRQIEVYKIGSGDISLLLIGGIHGGYEWNSTLLAWEMIDHFTFNPNEIPANVTLHIIPVLNPDGLAMVVGTSSRFTQTAIPNPSERVAAGRFNTRAVDINRNFDCNWQPESTWRGQTVSAGTAPFSEPEAALLRDYVLSVRPAAVLFWHSQADTVYGSACNDGVLPLTRTLGERYATAANYGWVPLFDAYPITGDAEGWLASIGVPALTVELESYQDSEFERNLAGVRSWLDFFAK